MSAPGSFSDVVKQQADIVRIVGDYVRLKKSGSQNFSGLCPFHNEKTPSFSVHTTRQFFHCFGCHASGDVFTFVQKIENITFPEAVRLVAQKLGIPLPKAQYDSPTEARDARLRGVLLDMHERACLFFQDQLRRAEGARAREYLIGRGLTDDIIREFRIGYAPDSGFVLRDRLKGEFDEESLRSSGLFSWKEAEAASKPTTTMYSKFRERVMFPIANDGGKVIAFTGRTLLEGDKAGPKYLNSPETPIYSKSRVLFNLDKAKESIRRLDYTILVEGQMDCISVYAAGFRNVIATSGTAFTEPQARLLARFSRNVVVNFDPDTAGAAATERTLGLLVEEEFQVKVVQLESGLDPDLFIRRRGRDAYADALHKSQKYFDYLIDRARAQFPPRTPESKVKALNYLLPHVHRVPSRIVRDELAANIAQKLAIDSAVLRQELKQAAAARSGGVKTAAQSPVTDAERLLVRALAPGGDFDLRARCAQLLASEPLHHGLGAESLIQALLSADDAADAASVRLETEQRNLLASILMREDEELTPELLDRSLAALRRRSLERRQRDIKSQIADAERRQDAGLLASLVQEKLRIDRQLASGT
jgi:DNA primase